VEVNPTPTHMTSSKPKSQATKKKSTKATAKKAAKPTVSPAAKKRAKKAAKHAHENNRNPLRADQMSGELVEFITAIDSYKRIHERPFPSWSEILVIVKALGYERAG
jgi:hypothetical protein